MKKLLAECVGTMFLVLLACGSAVLAGPTIGVLGIGLCFGLVLICLAYCLGNVSGCHVNPAVSLACWLSGRMSAKDFVGYVVAQFVGAAIGGGLLYLFVSLAPDYNFGGTTVAYGNHEACQLATNVVQEGATTGLALVAEILLTFFFVMVVLGTTDSKHGCGNFAGLAIGIALGLVNIVGIPVDNCSVNPARSFGPALWDSAAWPDFWIMVVGPVVGALLAVVCWKAVAGCCCKNKAE
jgi:aquaporin Z